MGVIRWVDLPPVWLLGFLALSWAQAQLWPMLTGFEPLGAVMVVLGLGLMAAAAVQMIRQRTSVIPRHDASVLMKDGVFMLSRNPIYLGDAFVLAGASLWWGAVPALLLVPLFMWLISWRFIEDEEAMLAEKFGRDFTAYKRETRRWL